MVVNRDDRNGQGLGLLQVLFVLQHDSTHAVDRLGGLHNPGAASVKYSW
jgi:hypothetical protein